MTQAEKSPPQKKSRGRPKSGSGIVISWRLPPGMADRLDAWIAASDAPEQSRADAVRRLVEIALDSE